MNTSTDPIKISAFLSNSRKDSWSSVIFTPFQGGSSLDERLFGLISLSSKSELDCLKYGEILRGYIFPKFYEVEANSLVEKLEYTISSVESELRSLLKSKKTEDHEIDLNIFLGTIFEAKLYVALLGDYRLEIFRGDVSQELNSFLKAATHGSKIKVASMNLEEKDILLAYSPNLHDKVLDVKFNSCFSKFGFETLNQTPLKSDLDRINILQIGYQFPDIREQKHFDLEQIRIQQVSNKEQVVREEMVSHMKPEMSDIQLPQVPMRPSSHILQNVAHDFLENNGHNVRRLEQVENNLNDQNNYFANEYEKDNFPPRDLSYEILYGKKKPYNDIDRSTIQLPGSQYIPEVHPTQMMEREIYQEQTQNNVQNRHVEIPRENMTSMAPAMNTDMFAQNIKTRDSIYRNIPKPNLEMTERSSGNGAIASLLRSIRNNTRNFGISLSARIATLAQSLKNSKSKRFEQKITGTLQSPKPEILRDDIANNNVRYDPVSRRNVITTANFSTKLMEFKDKLPFLSKIQFNKKLLPLGLLILLITAGIILNLVNKENQRRADEALLSKNTQILSEAKSLVSRAESASLTARADIKTSLTQATTKYNLVKQSQIASLQNDVQTGLTKIAELTDTKIERNIVLNEGNVSLTDLNSSFPSIQMAGMEVIGDKIYVADRTGNIYEGTFDATTNKYGFINILTTKLPALTIDKMTKDLSGNLILYSSVDGVYKFSLTDKTLTKLNEFTSSNLGSIVSMLSYDLGGTEFLYYLDQQNSALKRSSKNGNNYSNPSSRITNDAFKQSTDFDIDGKIWVCTNTAIKRFYDGKEEIFSYDLTQFNTQPGVIQNIALDDKYVYASDIQNSRIIITDKGNPLDGGKVVYIGNVVLRTKSVSKFDNIIDVKISNGYIYILDSKRVYRWQIVIPTMYL